MMMMIHVLIIDVCMYVMYISCLEFVICILFPYILIDIPMFIIIIV